MCEIFLGVCVCIREVGPDTMNNICRSYMGAGTINYVGKTGAALLEQFGRILVNSDS